METKQKKEKKRIKHKLEDSLKKGAFLYLDGELSYPDKISKALLREDGLYMADYVTDEKGYVREIRYDRVRL